MSEPVAIAEAPPRGQLLLRLTPEARARAGEALGFEVPATPLTSSEAEGALCLWLGPDEWLLTVAPEQVADVERALREALAGTHHAIVDVGDRTVIVQLDGPVSRRVLAAGCPLDLHPRSFPLGAVARSTLGKVGVILHRRGEDAFELHVERSYIGYLAPYLAEAALELQGAG